jgi:hypothetical protein
MLLFEKLINSICFLFWNGVKQKEEEEEVRNTRMEAPYNSEQNRNSKKTKINTTICTKNAD